ncbi:MAG: hypothetical protein LBF88_06350, partial [Planctomycetaceae bacterium]|nr:hypothetical protein [Planctomycetaceae bacterium]
MMLQLAVLAHQKAVASCEVSPSGAIPVYQKEPSRKRCRKPGTKLGHSGSHRHPPEKITRQESHRLECCPNCDGVLRPRSQVRKRYIEDIPEQTTPEITEHLIHASYCPRCRKVVEPVLKTQCPEPPWGIGRLFLRHFCTILLVFPFSKSSAFSTFC